MWSVENTHAKSPSFPGNFRKILHTTCMHIEKKMASLGKTSQSARKTFSGDEVLAFFTSQVDETESDTSDSEDEGSILVNLPDVSNFSTSTAGTTFFGAYECSLILYTTTDALILRNIIQ